MVVKEVFALVIGYLVGSIPTAYLITRLVRKQDIRHIGGGNIGALNTIREVGKLPGFTVILIDMAKGAAAVCIAFFALGVPPLFVMLAGFAVVIGHLWMIFLKFSGGRGMGTAIGSIVTILSLYGEWTVLGVFAAFIVIPLLTTRNVPLSMFAGFLALPFLTGFIAHKALGTILAVVLELLLAGKFVPTATASWKRSKGLKNFIFHHTNKLK